MSIRLPKPKIYKEEDVQYVARPVDVQVEPLPMAKRGGRRKRKAKKSHLVQAQSQAVYINIGKELQAKKKRKQKPKVKDATVDLHTGEDGFRGDISRPQELYPQRYGYSLLGQRSIRLDTPSQIFGNVPSALKNTSYAVPNSNVAGVPDIPKAPFSKELKSIDYIPIPEEKKQEEILQPKMTSSRLIHATNVLDPYQAKLDSLAPLPATSSLPYLKNDSSDMKPVNPTSRAVSSSREKKSTLSDISESEFAELYEGSITPPTPPTPPEMREEFQAGMVPGRRLLQEASSSSIDSKIEDVMTMTVSQLQAQVRKLGINPTSPYINKENLQQIVIEAIRKGEL